MWQLWAKSLHLQRVCRLKQNQYGQVSWIGIRISRSMSRYLTKVSAVVAMQSQQPTVSKVDLPTKQALREIYHPSRSLSARPNSAMSDATVAGCTTHSNICLVPLTWHLKKCIPSQAK